MTDMTDTFGGKTRGGGGPPVNIWATVVPLSKTLNPTVLDLPRRKKDYTT